ncbi:MAG: hypothetical protein GF308_17360 [Candidatus Heimdallarchaeota archaeon]|nr:hypothetical protein [Candidatus Heimdallarchaeota archaeon]
MDFDTLKDDLLALADTGLKYAKNKGAEQAEIYTSNMRNITINTQAGMIDAKDGFTEGVGVRIALGKKIGFASMCSLTDEAVKHAVNEAYSVAKSINQKNVGFEGFSPKKPPSEEGILDDQILELSTEHLVERVNKIYLEASNYDDRIITASGRTTSFYGGYAVTNTEGVEAATRATAFVLITSATAAANGKRKNAFDFEVSRTFPKMEQMGAKCAEKAIKLLASQPLDYTGVLPTLWDQRTMSTFWQMSLIHSINGRQVVEKNSYFMDKLGDKVATDQLNIKDDGQLPEGLSTASIDEEGIPRQTTPIIEEGILRSFLYDSYYGRLGKATSTGNASRQQNYESTPQISPTTIVITPGTKDFDALVSEIDKGVLVTDSVMGLGHSNLISGDFSCVATAAYLIENGEITHPLDSIQIAGNLYKSFKDIRAIGSDVELLQSVKTPSIIFDGFTLTG